MIRRKKYENDSEKCSSRWSGTFTLNDSDRTQRSHAAALAGHLPFWNDALHIHATFPTAPAVGVDSVLVLEAREAATHKIIDITDDVAVVLWMPSMGHGSAPTQVERAVDAKGDIVPGVFNVKNVYFTMGGDWEVRVILTNQKGQSETASFNVKVAGSGGGHGGHRH